jgi:hypothetical protein
MRSLAEPVRIAALALAEHCSESDFQRFCKGLELPSCLQARSRLLSVLSDRDATVPDDLVDWNDFDRLDIYFLGHSDQTLECEFGSEYLLVLSFLSLVVFLSEHGEGLAGNSLGGFSSTVLAGLIYLVQIQVLPFGIVAAVGESFFGQSQGLPAPSALDRVFLSLHFRLAEFILAGPELLACDYDLDSKLRASSVRFLDIAAAAGHLQPAARSYAEIVSGALRQLGDCDSKAG